MSGLSLVHDQDQEPLPMQSGAELQVACFHTASYVSAQELLPAINPCAIAEYDQSIRQ